MPSAVSSFPTTLVERLAGELAQLPSAALVGLSGLPGSGKGRLAAQLRAAAQQQGLRVAVLGLDDFYLGRRARLDLARTLHPLLATRGVPGTHDLPLLGEVLDALPRASRARPVPVPRFDKGRDTRLPPSRWPLLRQPPDRIILEGWCAGVPAQSARELVQPCNALEREEDADGAWRCHVNAALAGDYARLWQRLDRLWLLEAPAWEVVADWRGEQEAARLARAAPRALDRAALGRFLLHYERLGRHALATLPARADLRVRLGPGHEVIACLPRLQPAPAAAHDRG